MRTARVEETEIARHRDPHLPHCLVGMEVDVLVLHTPPPRTGRPGRQPLDEHTVDPTSLAVHAHPHAPGLQRLVGVLGRELAPRVVPP